MPDLKGLEISDIFGLSEPLTKLIETVSCGVGKLYEPAHIKRLAKAKAEEIKLISDTVTDNLNLPISYQNGEIGIDAIDANNLLQRAQNRFLFQQMKKQQNIESAVAYAYTVLEMDTDVSEKPVDEDWISTFFDLVANVSSDQMQRIWGKLLAGEIKCPGSYSIRTLDTVRKLTQKEAKLFTNYVPYILRCFADESRTGCDYFLLADEIEGLSLKNKYKYSYTDLMLLEEAGLFTTVGMLSVGGKIKPGESFCFIGRNKTIEITNRSFDTVKVGHFAYILTENGKELFKTIESMNRELPPDQFYEDCLHVITHSDLLSLNDHHVSLESKIIHNS